MPYIQEICIAGRTKEVTKYFSSRYGKRNIPRSDNKNKTKEEMKRINEMRSRKKVRRLVNANFGYKDIHLTLTYRRDLRPTPEEAKDRLTKFLRRLRNYYKKNGMVLKYIWVTEFKTASIHHHLIINSIDTRGILDLWEYGNPNIKYLDNTGQYQWLADYLIKETSKRYKDDVTTGKRWNSSKNLKKPKIIKKVVRSNSWRKDPKATKGYVLNTDSIKTGFHEITGHMFQFYSMTKIEGG